MRIGECGQPHVPGDGSASEVEEQPVLVSLPPPGMLTDEPVTGEMTPVTGASTGPQRPSALGIWAFVLALLGAVGLLPVVGSVLGLVLGRVAVRQSLKRRVVGGRGLALSAVIVSVVTLTIIVVVTAGYALFIAYGTR